MMIKRFKEIFTFLMLFLVGNVLYADELKVKSFSVTMEPMTVPMQRVDKNGEVCALVKVIIPSAQAAFEGNLIGQSDYKTSEYWCYLTPGSKFLKIKYPGCDPLLVNFEDLMGAALQGKRIYELKIEAPVTNVQKEKFDIPITINFANANRNELESLEKGIRVFLNYRNGSFDREFESGKGRLTINNVSIGDSITVTVDDSRFDPTTQVITLDDLRSDKKVLSVKKKKVNITCKLVDKLTGRPVPNLSFEVSRGNGPNIKSDSLGILKIVKTIDAPMHLRPVYGNSGFYDSKKNEIVLGYYKDIKNPRVTVELERNIISNYITMDNNVKLEDFTILTDNDNPFFKVTTELFNNGYNLKIEYPAGFDTEYVSVKRPGYKTVRLYGPVFTGWKPLKMKKGKESEIIEYRSEYDQEKRKWNLITTEIK